MSYQNQQLGGQAFNHGPSSSAETEYDRLRSLAREEQGKHQHFAAQASQAYSSGDGAGAHNASEQSKQHAAAADNYNKQASEFIFRENNAVGKVAADTIDLHGQYVEEAEEILEQRIRYAQSTGQTHLHVIVGKGNHSPGHIQKIKPKVEALCQELGLQYSTEHNEGRMFIQLQPGAGGGGGGQQQQQGGGQQQMPGYDYQQHYQPQHQNYGQPLYQSAYPMGGSPNYSYAQAAAGGYPGAGQQQQQMQYGGQQQQQQQNGGYPGKPQQQFDASQQQGQQDEGVKCCGIKICVVM
ncbi:hypothetical protein LTR02_006337 [Friedmanniomyces endolithicus]|nr:hypothetical protein LTR94_008992 [Friedmanniomyces endolithicus]KAK0780811.1 hypothetical protein LTR59_012715 [Friedmanniomyces endolithicus]KAK0786256.1 hypothetical protein LTR38_012077 [Friedmanniomyces endolithicus]KAK0808596.1 hypothetical protein LTR75_006173 [Friedmanniomyces endolithicus]KAK0854628.1 hypothetical protein LTS02_011431 [Friedmanniomyces endolithicus]